MFFALYDSLEIQCSLALTPRAAGTLSGVGCSFELTAGANTQREVYDGTGMPKHVSCMWLPAKWCRGKVFLLHVDCNLNILLSNGKCHQAMNNMSRPDCHPVQFYGTNWVSSALVSMRIAIWSPPPCFCYLLSVICYLKHDSSGVLPLGDPFPGDPKSRREIGCGLDEAACEFSGIGHGSILWKLNARTMHAQGHKI